MVVRVLFSIISIFKNWLNSHHYWNVLHFQRRFVGWPSWKWIVLVISFQGLKLRSFKNIVIWTFSFCSQKGCSEVLVPHAVKVKKKLLLGFPFGCEHHAHCQATYSSSVHGCCPMSPWHEDHRAKGGAPHHKRWLMSLPTQSH